MGGKSQFFPTSPKWHNSWPEETITLTKSREMLNSRFLLNNRVPFIDCILPDLPAVSPEPPCILHEPSPSWSHHQISITWITGMFWWSPYSILPYICTYIYQGLPGHLFPSCQIWWHRRQIRVRALVLEPHSHELASCMYLSLWTWPAILFFESQFPKHKMGWGETLCFSKD